MRRAAAWALAALACGCATAPGAETPGPALADTPTSAREESLLVPPGHGTLRQDEVSLVLAADGVLLKVTPLEEWVTRLTAPDTWSRLNSLAATHGAEAARRAGEPTRLFLVSFFSATAGASFRPDDVRLVSRGSRLRALAVRAVTGGWGTERLEAERTETAVYAFPATADLEQPLTLEYGTESTSAWTGILRRLDQERARARARSGR